MIGGIGIDLVETARIRRTVEKFGERFFARVYTQGEIQYCKSMKNPDGHLAARFAAKEAVSKCFGTGIGRGVGWKDIEVRHDAMGKPIIELHGGGAELARKMSVKTIHVSLTHTEQYGCAVAVLET